MRVINLLISLFSIIKTKALEYVNEGVGEALFYPYNVLVNKCTGSCDTLANHMSKMYVPNIIKRVKYESLQFFDEVK